VVYSSQEELAAVRAARKRRIVFIGLLAGLLAILSVGGNRSLLRIYRMNRTRAELRKEIEQLTQANRALAREVHLFRSSPWAVEAIAREDLGLVRPGELVFEFGASRQPSLPRTAPR
jgi:cell division protein FtsB